MVVPFHAFVLIQVNQNLILSSLRTISDVACFCSLMTNFVWTLCRETNLRYAWQISSWLLSVGNRWEKLSQKISFSSFLMTLSLVGLFREAFHGLLSTKLYRGGFRKSNKIDIGSHSIRNLHNIPLMLCPHSDNYAFSYQVKTYGRPCTKLHTKD